MLLDQRDLRLDREDDVAEPSGGSVVRGGAGEDPGGSLLVHEPPRSVDRIDEDSPAAIRVPCAMRQRQAARGQTFGYQTERFVAGNLGEAVHERGLADAIDRVDRVAFVVVGDA